jgi:cobalt-zinc-cadmium efflux system protein
VADVHDLHVWAMGTSDVALTAHLVLTQQVSDTNALLHEAEHELHEHFEIRHATLQLESPSYAQRCAQRTGASCQ